MIVTQLHKGCGGEHSLWAHYQRAIPEAVQIAHYEQQIGCLLNWQKPTAWHVDACNTNVRVSVH